ncbi:MAG TPA: hypothetical protein VMC62_11820 [Longilinea sp.]|nr:hypothetical protein [Longilinea sp.]
MSTRSRLAPILLIVAFLVLVQLACSLSVNTGESTATVPAESTAAPTALPIATQVPAPTQTTAAAATCASATFTLDPSIAASTAGVIIPQPTEDPNGTPWAILPQYVTYSFSGYPLQGTQLAPLIDIIPVASLNSFNPQLGQEATDLKTLLAAKQVAANANIPFLPPYEAAQVFHAQVSFLNFQNGSGVRFVTQYDQAYMPISNKEVFYTFQGLTSDGNCYIAIILPVSNTNLQADDSIPGGDFNAFSNNFPNYLTSTVNMLNSQAADSFTPRLDVLDNFVASLTVQ